MTDSPIEDALDRTGIEPFSHCEKRRNTGENDHSTGYCRAVDHFESVTVSFESASPERVITRKWKRTLFSFVTRFGTSRPSSCSVMGVTHLYQSARSRYGIKDAEIAGGQH
jgi:hypothetical protein